MFQLFNQKCKVAVFTNGKYDVFYDPKSLRLAYRSHHDEVSDQTATAFLDSSEEKAYDGSRNLMLRLLITNKCNLNCSYCQMKKLMQKDGAADLSYENIDLLLDKLEAEKYDYVTIHFSGGEPLIALNRIRYVCENVKKRGIENVRFAISTNGILLKDEAVRLLKEYDVQTVVSVDDLREENSLRRNYAGHSFVGEVLRNSSEARAQGLRLGISTVFVRDTEDNVVDFVDKLHNDYAVDSLGFNYQHYSGFEKGNIDHADDYMAAYASALIKVSDRCREYNIFEEQSNRIIEPFVYKTQRKCHCTSQSSQVTVLPSGMLSPCKTFASANRDITSCASWVSDSEESNIIFSHWRGRRTDTVSPCKNCIYRALCGGGCPYEAYVDCGSIYHADARYCVVVEMFFLHMLDKLEQFGVFDTASAELQEVTDAQRQQLLTCTNADKLKLTASIGHFLEA